MRFSMRHTVGKLIESFPIGEEGKLEVSRREIGILVLLTMMFFTVSVWNLGSTTIPTTTWRPAGASTFRLDLGGEQYIDSVEILVRDPLPVNLIVYTDRVGNSSRNTSFSATGHYEQWDRIEVKARSRHLTFVFANSLAGISELVVLDADGRRLQVVGIDGVEGGTEALSSLVDEQEKVEEPPTFRSSTYFDEIYYVRTAEEHLAFEEPFEWTHPPLGKLIIAVGMANFGFNPFGWRIMGVVFSSLMIPVMYMLAKCLFEGVRNALLASLLFGFDFMRFTMGRMATVDTFVVFLSLLMYLFFFTYAKGLYKSGWREAYLPILLTILCFGLAFSTKWYAFYGFLSVAFLFAMLKLKEYALIRKGKSSAERDYFLRPILVAFLSLVLAGIAYLTTYLPYIEAGHSLQDVFKLQFTMYGFHSGLTASHPFSSAWWTWPFLQRPVWLYYRALPRGLSSSITAMGNPAIWLPGIAIMVTTIPAIVRRKDSTAVFIVVPFLFQWLSYAFISRTVFLYHYYISTPFLVLALVHSLSDLWDRKYGRILTAVWLAASAALFLLFYPVISGYPMLDSQKVWLRWLPSWSF